MDQSDIQKKLIDFICDAFMVEEDEIILDESLVDQGIIDSIGLIELSSFLASTWGIQVEEKEMTKDNFGSVKKIIAFIQEKLKSV